MLKMYIVKLSDAERETLTEIFRKLKGSSQRVRRAQVLLKADADGPAWTDAKLAEAFGLGYFRAGNHAELKPGIISALTTKRPLLCEIVLDLNQQFAPKLSSRRLPDGTMVSSPLEDLAPFLSREELAENMLIPLWEG